MGENAKGLLAALKSFHGIWSNIPRALVSVPPDGAELLLYQPPNKSREGVQERSQNIHELVDANRHVLGLRTQLLPKTASQSPRAEIRRS